jgi:hypothetical protein
MVSTTLILLLFGGIQFSHSQVTDTQENYLNSVEAKVLSDKLESRLKKKMRKDIYSHIEINSRKSIKKVNDIVDKAYFRLKTAGIENLQNVIENEIDLGRYLYSERSDPYYVAKVKALISGYVAIGTVKDVRFENSLKDGYYTTIVVSKERGLYGSHKSEEIHIRQETGKFTEDGVKKAYHVSGSSEITEVLDGRTKIVENKYIFFLSHGKYKYRKHAYIREVLNHTPNTVCKSFGKDEKGNKLYSLTDSKRIVDGSIKNLNGDETERVISKVRSLER